jgi:3-(3-hydroxy-phenyl)propionate hydroxylase
VVDGRWRDPAHAERADPFEFHCDPRRPAVTGALPQGRQRWEFMLDPGESAQDLERPEVVAELLGPWAAPDAVEVLRATVYVFHARVAARWRVGRVLLLGDAAHLSPPFLGQGLSAGLRDADLLARALPAALAGRGSLAPLDRWARERRREVVVLTTVAVLLGSLIQIRNPRAAALRDRLLRPVLARPRVRAWLAAGRWKPRSGPVVPETRLSSPESRAAVSSPDDHD